jgi:hypothetical protein
MRKVFLCGMVVVLAALAAACFGGSLALNQKDIQAHVDATNKDLDIVDEVLPILETVKDEASAKAAKPKLDALLKKHRELLKANESLPRLSPKEYNAYFGKTHYRQDAAEKKLREQKGRDIFLNIPSGGVIKRIIDEFVNAFSSTKTSLPPYDPN